MDKSLPVTVPALDIPMSSVRDWLVLLKPRVVSLVVFTGMVGMLVAPAHLNPVLGTVAILCIGIGAGAAGVLNMWYDRDIDALMRRTVTRPIPGGRIAPDDALAFGVTLAVGSVIVIGLATNLLAAAILAVSIAFYVFVYTIWLKRCTPQNIVIGGAAGAFPPLIGWAAVTGDVGVLPVLLFLIIFLWTPPHFWSLSLYAHADYRRAGVPMLPVVAGAKRTRREIAVYTVLLVGISLLPWAVGLAGLVYGLTASAMGLGFLAASWRVLRDRQTPDGTSLTKDQPARAAFRYSLVYLAILFTAMALDRLLA